MNQRNRAAKALWMAIVVAALTIWAARSDAGYKTVVDGITISYSGDGATAYYDSTNSILTIEITQAGGSLKVTAGRDAYQNWGNYVDIFLAAEGVTLKSITIKGSADCMAYICGEVGYVSKFSLSNGAVGDTDTYGQDYGLGMTSLDIPLSISMKNSYTTAQLFGYSYSTNSVLAVTSAKRSAKGVSSQPPAATK